MTERSTIRNRLSSSVLGFVFVCIGFQVGAWAFSLPAVVQELDLGVGQLGVTLSLMAASGMAGSLSAGVIAERLTVRLAMAGAAALSGLGYVTLPLLGSFTTFTVGAVITGFGLGVFDVTANAAGSLEEIRRSRSLLAGLHARFSFAAAAAVFFAFLVNGASEYGPALYGAGVVCLAAGATALLLPAADQMPKASPDSDQKAPPTHDLEAIRTVATVLALTVVCGSFAIDATLEGFSALFIEELPGQGQTQIAVGLASLYLASALGRSVSSRAIGRFGDWPTLLGGLLLTGLGAALLVSAVGSWGTVVGMLLIGAGLAPAAPIGYSVMGRSQSHRVERSTARLTTAGYGSFLLAPLVVGAVGGESLSDAFVFLPVLVAVMAGVAVWFGLRQRIVQSRPVFD